MKNKVRKIAITCCLSLILISVKAQFVTIPDANFVTWLSTHGYATCMSGNQLDTTCSLVINAATITCPSSNIGDLTGISYFDNLTQLSCWGNNLATLPPLPDGIGFLECSQNQLTSLPALPSALGSFYCSNNLLSSFPALPTGISSFECSYNQLTSLPTLPASLHYFYCDHNLLTSLPALPDSLWNIGCEYNQLTTFPAPPASLSAAYISYNQLTSLPAFPYPLSELYIDNNLSLMCLNYIAEVGDLIWDNTGITCLANAFNVTGSATPPLTGIPVCDLFNTSNCISAWNALGIIYTDNNANCLVDSNEIMQSNIKVNLIQNGNIINQTFSNVNGQYSFDTDTGSFDILVDTTGLPITIDCPVSSSYSIHVDSINTYHINKDFSVICKPGYDIGVNSVIRKSGVIRAGNKAGILVLAGDMGQAFNLNCAAGISGSVRVIISGPAIFDSIAPGALTPVVNGDTLLYTIADFGIVDFNHDFSFTIQTNNTAQINDNVCFQVEVLPLAGDNNIFNNTHSHCFSVVGSFDPNEKEVSPNGTTDTSQHWLTYTIYFQNTGNALAQHIYLLDTLDNNLDENSIQLLSFSHEPIVQVTGNVVRFNFPNINLPDSVNDEPNSHGYVQYKVKRMDNLPVGTQIRNTAYIYFDFNPPVVTNTTLNQLAVIAGITSNNKEKTQFSIYPNPLSSGNTLNLFYNSASQQKATLNIYELSGRKVYSSSINSSSQSQKITLNDLAQGIYQCVIDGVEGSAHQKLVIVK